MIQQTISDLEAKINAEPMSASTKGELLQLIATLKTEIAVLYDTSGTSREKQKVLKSSVEELRSSVAGFEQSHPKLIQAVNNISTTLSNWGV
jgi:G:T/U-mismatch repair DNA glycosylase